MAGSLKRQMARAFGDSDLSESPTVETSIDRIGALGKADSLGAKLWRLRLGNDPACYKPVLYSLVKIVRGKKGELHVMTRVCEAALNEWLFDACPTCNGRGVTVFPDTDQVHKACPTCAGTLVRRYSDTNRARTMGWSIDVQRKWNATFNRVHEAISEAFQQVAVDLNWHLERTAAAQEAGRLRLAR